MKLKKLWIPMFILTVIGGCAKICDTLFNVHGEGFFLDTAVCNGILVGCIVLMLLLGLIFGALDKKVELNAKPSKNILTGIFGFISSVMLVGGSVINLLSMSDASIATMVGHLLVAVAGCVLLFESCISFTGTNGMKKVPLLTLLVPLGIAARFIMLFATYKSRSVMSMEIFDMVADALLLMFFLYQSMFYAGVNNSLAVRKTNVYGYTFFIAGLVVAVDLFIKMSYPMTVTNVDTEIVEPTLINIMNGVCYISLSIYALCMLYDMQKAPKEQSDEDDDDDYFGELEADSSNMTEPVKNTLTYEATKDAENEEEQDITESNEEPDNTDKAIETQETGKSENEAEMPEAPVEAPDMTPDEELPRSDDDNADSTEAPSTTTEAVTEEPVQQQSTQAIDFSQVRPVVAEPVEDDGIVETESEPLDDEVTAVVAGETDTEETDEEKTPVRKPDYAEEEDEDKKRTDDAYAEILSMLDDM